MRNKPNIIVTSVDAKRLETLLDSLSPNSFPGMSELEAELERAKVVAPEELPGTVVTMNSTVKFRVEPSGEEFVMTLVYPGSEDSQGQKISILAPVGSALLGLTQGDEIEWPRPGGGTMRVAIMDVIYQPERSGDFCS
ncbi:nucleoside diphosphate kinase regulator [Desulfonatronum sp. SC1]|uniref:nucleoside diphosphate kinase regulator n=1 Tax=Desulfonatronum sp. SC1 TaxID=2109626 RepID=UPI000D313BF6|nr:nucleoside diphosphate kinase regulator [Desulfonatronum sp. SC1]PTN33202.1 nucleoside diphosphate kinase regulator [Desulfonatronum sp. SC1]